MKLNEFEESIVHEFIMGFTDLIPDEYDDILAKAELGIQIKRPVEFEIEDVRLGIVRGASPVFSLRPKGTALLIFTQDAHLARSVLVAFRKNVIQTLTVRVERSWRCYIQCGDRIIEKTCEEDKDSTEACCNSLRDQC
ncbi:hypothetical protein [Ruegeria sp. HKCCA0235A]|uniref:hypothetical protein n=1 Tax=Ruegeria sp. HKCCA0235A TaxID=2682998 RepID=UPI001488F667|nr:hypothetical protein [Ruegeria sp. HKCCA0235A]